VWEESVAINKNKHLYKKVGLLKVRRDWPVGMRRRVGKLDQQQFQCPACFRITV
jgi:hypothetical protein